MHINFIRKKNASKRTLLKRVKIGIKRSMWTSGWIALSECPWKKWVATKNNVYLRLLKKYNNSIMGDNKLIFRTNKFTIASNNLIFRTIKSMLTYF
jgi:hypothetical protein